MQIINHKIDGLYDLLEKIAADNDNRFNQLMGRVTPMHDQVSAVQRNVEKVERTTMETLRDLESKDFQDFLTSVHQSISQGHNALSSGIPLAISDSKFKIQLLVTNVLIEIVVDKKRPSIFTFLLAAVAVQIMVVGAYMMYKKRRNSAPKKYL